MRCDRTLDHNIQHPHHADRPYVINASSWRHLPAFTDLSHQSSHCTQSIAKASIAAVNSSAIVHSCRCAVINHSMCVCSRRHC